MLAPADAWVAGEDSGIEVAALGGRPGVHSSRWAEDGVAQLLIELGGQADRRARYVCAIAHVAPGGVEHVFEASCEGTLANEPSGGGGFGYDPLFVPVEHPDRTMAELTDAEKDAISHRGRAARELLAWLTAS